MQGNISQNTEKNAISELCTEAKMKAAIATAGYESADKMIAHKEWVNNKVFTCLQVQAIRNRNIYRERGRIICLRSCCIFHAVNSRGSLNFT